MPSTHTANCISAALFMHDIASQSQLSGTLKLLADGLILIYAGSVVLGRVYCGMHGLSDCVAGAILGCFTFAVNSYLGDSLENWMINPSLFSKHFIYTFVSRLCGDLISR